MLEQFVSVGRHILFPVGVAEAGVILQCFIVVKEILNLEKVLKFGGVFVDDLA